MNSDLTLCNFPSKSQRMRHIGERSIATVLKVEQLSIGDKRNCFLALRSHAGEIFTYAVFVPLDITVGELAFSQVISSKVRVS